jgi:hypothetical protein
MKNTTARVFEEPTDQERTCSCRVIGIGRGPRAVPGSMWPRRICQRISAAGALSIARDPVERGPHGLAALQETSQGGWESQRIE